jgi:hypothetical protein
MSSTPIGGTSGALTVAISGAQDFTTTGITDVAAVGSLNAPTSATDVINVTDTGNVNLGTTNFGTVNAAPTASLVVVDSFHHSTILGSSAGNNTITGGDGGGALNDGNTITGGTATDTIVTGIGSNTINLGATHIGDNVTIGSGFGGVMVFGGDIANQGSWGQAFGSAPEFIAGTLAGPTSSIFGNAASGGTDASVTTINGFDATSATSTDFLHFSASMWSGNGTANNNAPVAGINVALTDIAITAIVAPGVAVDPTIITTSGQATTAGSNLVEISGVNQFSGAPALAAGLINTGSFDLKIGGGGGLFANNNVHFLIGYTDGHNIHIADVDVYNTTAAAVTDTSTVGVHVYASDVVELMGVNSFANLNAHLAATFAV